MGRIRDDRGKARVDAQAGKGPKEEKYADEEEKVEQKCSSGDRGSSSRFVVGSFGGWGIRMDADCHCHAGCWESWKASVAQTQTQNRALTLASRTGLLCSLPNNHPPILQMLFL